MPYPMSYELYRAPGFYAWFCKEPRPCGNNTLNIYPRHESLLIDKR